jgi:DnaJ-domain-containing protein 1
LKGIFEKSENLGKKSAPEHPPALSQLKVVDHSPRNEQLETQKRQDSTVTSDPCVNTTVKIGKLKGSFENSQNLGKKSSPKNSPALSQLNAVGRTARNHSSRNEQLETQQHQNSTVTSNSCVNTTVKSDKVVDTTRESVKGAATKSQRVSHDMARNYSSDDLCTESGNSLQKNSADSSGTTVSTEPKNDTITSHVDDTHLETETNVDSQSGESSHPNKEETVSRRIDEIVGNKKPLPAEVDKARESSDLPKIPNESRPVTVQEESPQEEHQTEQSAEERSNISDKKRKEVTHDHVSLPEMRLYWDKRCGDDEATMENSSMSMRTGEESPTKSNETIGRRQVSNCGTESSRKFCTNPEVIDVDGVESEKEQDETKVKQSKPASDEKSLPAKRQSHTACSSSKPVAGDMGGSPTLKDLIDANAGAGKKKVNPRNIGGTKRKASGSQGERKSWQSTVIIVESSDEEKDDNHDIDIGGTTENGPEVEFLKTATSPPSKRRRGVRPLNPETKFNKNTTKREPLEQHLRTNGQYNFRFTEEEAAREQERLFKQAADRVRQNASMANQTSSTAAAGSVPRNINDLSHDHWRSPDLYRRLGLPPGAPIHLVKRQYRRLALRYHPDKGWKDVHTTDRFQAITEAYKVLSGECERL